jgi:hypothetical protein
MGIAGNAIPSRIDNADRQSVPDRRLAVNNVRGKADAEIGRYASARTPIGLHRLVFPRRQPEFHVRKIQADLDDFPEMVDSLQISRIMPPEVPVAGSVDEGADRIHPLRIG